MADIAKIDGFEIPAVAGVPSGAILLWHGTIANIPAGWVICDGNNSTPNLLTRFVEGVATAATDPGALGGATAKTTAGHQHVTLAWSAAGSWGGSEVALWGTNTESVKLYNTTSLYGGPSDYPMMKSKSETDGITDIRPLYYDVAFIMKT